MNGDHRLHDEIFGRLDLGPIMVKLRHELGWDAARVEGAAKDYRRWLYLVGKTDQDLVPVGDIDDVWHAHILDTAKYAADCDAIFGFFFHHFPYLGLRGEEDERQLYDCVETTMALWVKTFGCAPTSQGTRRVCSKVSNARVCSSSPELARPTWVCAVQAG